MLAKPCVGAVSKFDERNPGGERRNRGFEWRDGGVNWRICPRGQRLAPRETVSSSVSDLPHSDVCRAATCGKASESRRQRCAMVPRHWPPPCTSRAV